ncbi:polysaccharide biosynthesis protein, partial [Staphylococcus aureus]|uniref:polysaccharide biosynthesis protein n=1 Tax=Staphylococcus aureus TaxID=1280 RepID=UPI00210A7201
MFDDKILLITGGTVSFGNAVMKRFLDSNIKEIRIFSRDDVSIFRSERGLTENIVREISTMKNEPEWMLDFRLQS